MAGSTRRIADAPPNDERIKRIAEAAQARFDRFGFQKTTMEEVARDAGVSKKTIYTFFPSKERLFAFVMERVAGAIRRRLEQEISAEEGAVAKLSRLLRVILRQTAAWGDSGHAGKFHIVEPLAARAFRDAMLPLFADLVRQGGVEGVFAVPDAGLAADLIAGAVARATDMLKERSLAEVEPVIIKMVLGGLRRS